jgi:hypothetical protein
MFHSLFNSNQSHVKTLTSVKSVPVAGYRNLGKRRLGPTSGIDAPTCVRRFAVRVEAEFSTISRQDHAGPLGPSAY